MREDLPDDRGIVERGNQAQPAPQCGHAKTSMANARCMRAAQVQARGVGFTLASSGPAASQRVTGARHTPVLAASKPPA